MHGMIARTIITVYLTKNIYLDFPHISKILIELLTMQKYDGDNLQTASA